MTAESTGMPMKMFEDTAGDVIAVIRETPMIRDALRAKEQRITDDRGKAALALASLHESAAKEWKTAYDAEQEAAAAVRKAEIALKDANAKLSQASQRRMVVAHQNAVERDRLEAQLRATASPLIDAFIAKARDEFDNCQKATTPGVEVTRNPNTGAVTSNAAAIVWPRERILALRDVLLAAEEMKLDADQSNAEERLAALWSALPVIGAPKK